MILYDKPTGIDWASLVLPSTECLAFTNSGDFAHCSPCNIWPPQPYRKLEAPNQASPQLSG